MADGKEVSYRRLPYLFKGYAVRYEYSGTVLLEENPPQAPRRKYLGMAPAFEEGEQKQQTLWENLMAHSRVRGALGALPYSKEEVKNAAREFNGDTYLASEATKEAFLREAPQYRILHLATHAFIDDQNPLYSGLVFSGNPGDTAYQYLHAYELYNTRLNAELAVLSACNTGAGKLRKGEGIMSLSRAFKYAGCPSVVMSLWRASDLTAKDIMASFFQNLKAGAAKDEALRQAKLDFLRRQPNDALTHPFYWAPFVLIGDGAPVDMGGGWGRYLGAGGLMVLVLLVFVWRNRSGIR